jgi:isopentenyldiphosphate isomerase
MEELFPLVNEQGDLIGKATRKLCHSGSFLLHPVVHLHVFNPAGQLFLQKRSLSKDIQPGMWDTSVGGHVDFEETVAFQASGSLDSPAPWVLSALQREAREELGILNFEPIFVFRYTFRSIYEYELVHTFFTVYDGSIVVDPIEISEGRFWDRSEVLANLGKGVFTPNFEGEILRVLEAFGD